MIVSSRVALPLSLACAVALGAFAAAGQHPDAGAGKASPPGAPAAPPAGATTHPGDPPPGATTSAGAAARPVTDGSAPGPAGQRVRITVRAIAASREAQAPEVDPRLSPIEADLHSLAGDFSYKSYRLVEEQTFDLDWKAPAQMELPGSRSLQVTPRALGSDGRIKVHLEVLGQHPEHARRLHTDYSVPRGRTILVGGYKLDPQKPDEGTLLIAITQAVEK